MTPQPSQQANSGLEHLKRNDDVMRKLIRIFGDLGKKKRPANFRALARIVVSQQLSTKAASTIFRRLEKACGRNSFSPYSIGNLSYEHYQNAGVSKAKRDYLIGIADLIVQEPNFFSKLQKKSDEEAMKCLTDIRGIGNWSASIFLMFHLGREDVFPSGDVSIKKAIANLYGNSAAENEEFSMRWSPFRTMACLYLWASVDQPVLI